MKVKIVSKEYNHLLKRKEVTFEAEHAETGGTPSRFEARKKLATLLKTDLELVYVKKMETKTGTMTAVGEANAYDSIEQAKLVEPAHIVARNVPPKQMKETEAPEKPAKPEETEAPEKPAKPEETEAPEKPAKPEETEEKKERS